ncbi:MAG: 23S rRNA (guanosine(2251)-2'-O)-methyltransferase RlmB [Acidimicrobiia bacterium]|nr:23S rRNA (guanosine(2251)-2'-O)-methyltransferase RlmB [Acidimicrobiia bacterium]
MTSRRPAGRARQEPSRRDDGGLGGEQVEGRRAVRELLVGRRRVRTVWVSSAAEPSALLDEIVSLAGPSLRETSPERIASLARTDVHQGVIATADAIRAASLDDLLGDPSAFLVALDGVTDPRNLGAVARVAETAGATGLVIPRHRAARITPAVAKSAAGAIEHLPIASVSGIPSALERAARAEVWVVGLDGSGDRDLYDLDLVDQPVVLVFGAEGRGLGRLTRQRCDVVAGIPMHGRIGSLNVAAAAAIACHEVARRRIADGA